MECPECKFQNPNGMQFCGKCGSKLATPCPKCEFENPDGFSFCGKCGYKLSGIYDTSKTNHTGTGSQTVSTDMPKPYTPESYTPKHLADKILTTRSSIEGERKLVTVLFADVANYTSLSEKLDPEEVHQIMDGCFKILMAEIHHYEGTINQFTGDGVMALFGAPVAHEDHAQRACYAAIKIQSSMEQYSKDLGQKFDIQFEMRVGINSGIVVVGSIGDDLRMDYTAVGDTTNLAARMESAARPGAILLSENTHKLVKNYFELESIGEIEIKGKGKLQKAFLLIKTSDVETRIGASVAKGLTYFVGRKKSMSTLNEVVKKAKSGSGQVVGVVGEAGVGKSRLLLEMKNMLPQGNFEYLEGRCLQYGSSILYLPILNILRSIFNIKDSDKEHIIKRKINDVNTNLNDKFKSFNSSFQDILSMKIDDEDYLKLEPKEKREKIFEAIRDLLIRMSQDKPLVIAVEDLHWIDKTSEEFLIYLIDWLASTNILLILLYRPEYTHQWGSKSFYTKIGIDQLGMSSSGELISAILEEGDVAPELSHLILSRSAGNPLFMEEFTHTLLENGSIEKKEDQFILKGNPEDIKVPDTIQGIIAARMDRLEDNLKRTMQVASVIGRDFAFKILQTITGMRSELKSSLLNLQGLEFIYEKNLFPELEYIFKHALTQEVAYNSLLQKRRKDLHGKIGIAIEELYSERLEEFYEILAYHYSKSDCLEKAAHYCEMSGEKAIKNFSHWDAYTFLKKAYDFLSIMSQSEKIIRKKINLLGRMTIALSPLGMPPEETTWALDTLLELSETLEDRNAMSRAYSAKANYFTHMGNTKMAIKYTKNAFNEAKIANDIQIMVSTGWALAFAYSASSEYSRIVEIIPDVIEFIEKEKREADFFNLNMLPYCVLCSYTGLGMGVLGDFTLGNNYLDKALENAYKTHDLMTIGSTELSFGLFYSIKGDWKATLEHIEISVEEMKKVQYHWIEALGWCCKGYANAMLGDFEKGKKYSKKGMDLHIESGVEVYLVLSYLYSGMMYSEAGDLKTAIDHLEKALKLSIKNNENNLKARIMTEIGGVLIKQKPVNFDKALYYINSSMDTFQKESWKPFIAKVHLFRGQLYLDTKKTERAIENLKIAEKMYAEMDIVFWLNRTKQLLSKSLSNI